MAKWSRKKIDSESINNGNEYEKKDAVSREQLNSIVNSGLYAQDFVEKLVYNIDTSEVGNVGTPSVFLVAGDGATAEKPYKKFKFSNLKGEIGATGNGIIRISKTGTSKLVDTYTISFTSGETTTFQVTNGKGITNIEKTATSGLVDTYTITFNDATTNTFQVTNGAKGDKGDKGDQGIQGEKGDQGIQGVQGEKGEKGDKGDTGVTPNITATATTLPAGSSVTVTKSGTAENPTFDFGIPKGEKGDKGDKGDQGESGLIYQTTGQNTDGAMSQKATTDELTAIATALSNKFSNHAQSAYNCNTCYDEGVYLIASGSNCPSGSQYGSLFVMPYRKPTGNTKPDFGVQIFIPNGDDSSKPNSMFYRTSLENSWNDWREVATTDDLTYKMSKSGGTFTGPVKFNETRNNCITYLNDFYIDSASTTKNFLGVNSSYSFFGNDDTILHLSGSSARPIYYQGNNASEFAFITDIPNISGTDLGIGTNIEGIKSWYATWRIKIGDIIIIGGATPGEEGKKTINFRMNNATGTNVFTSKIES